MNNYLEILKNNKGFEDPYKWVEYAKGHDFKRVESEQLLVCPDCRNSDSKKIGQYVYYSSLIVLRQCMKCLLIYADVKLNEDISEQHFDIAYKDQEYFEKKRNDIYLQIAGLAKSIVPFKGDILDVGGAQGHLGAVIKKLRPDLSITINDLSSKACDYTKARFGFDTLCCPLADLNSEQKVYDLILMIDILYYETNIRAVWEEITSLVRHGIIIRIPNKVWLIKFILAIRKFFTNKQKMEMLDKVEFFNPEHLYIFQRQYLKDSFRKSGFNNIKFIPSKSLVSNESLNILHKIFFHFAMLIYFLSMGKIIITPAQLICAMK